MKNFIIVAAIKSEFPFDEELPVLYTGIGKTNATFALCDYLNKNTKTQLVINVGSAGGVGCRKGAVVECGVFADGQLNYPGYTKELITFQASKNKCITFDSFVTESIDKTNHCLDMEAFSLAKTCQKIGVEFLCFKYISDIIGDKNQENEWLENHKEGKDLLRKAIQHII
jgi:adenosylhomocysteine nucleosidase